jgi:recombination protein RecA
MDRDQAINQARAMLIRQYGKDALITLAEEQDHEPVDVVHSGSHCLDEQLRIGGLPRGHLIEIFGPESGGKTTLALHAVAEFQKAGGIVAYIDADHTLDFKYARKIGVSLAADKLIVNRPESAEEALEIANTLARSSAIDLIVIDTVASIVPLEEVNGAVGSVSAGLQNRMLAKFLKNIASNLTNSECSLILITQERSVPSEDGMSYMTTSTGNPTLRFYAALRLRVSAAGAITNRDVKIGAVTHVEIRRNKFGTPYRATNLDLLYGSGFSKISDILELAIQKNIVKLDGANLTYKSYNFARKSEFRAELSLNPDLLEEILKDCLFPTITQ